MIILSFYAKGFLKENGLNTIYLENVDFYCQLLRLINFKAQYHFYFLRIP